MLKVIGGKDVKLFISSKAFERINVIDSCIKDSLIISARITQDNPGEWFLGEIDVPKQECKYITPWLNKNDYYKSWIETSDNLIEVPMLGIVCPFKSTFVDDKEIETVLRSISEEYFIMIVRSGEIQVKYFNHEAKVQDTDVSWTIDTSDWKLNQDSVSALIKSKVKRSTYSESYYSKYDDYGTRTYSSTTYLPETKKREYKDAEINKTNPTIASFGTSIFSFLAFKLLLQSHQENLKKYFDSALKEVYPKDKITSTDDYIYCEGTAPMMLVAHLDIKHYVYPTDVYFDRENHIIWSPTGIGGDDRCGIYLILQILNCKDIKNKPSLLFTMDEESGCLGAKKAAKELKGKIEGLKYLVELDRRGKDDVVFYDTKNEKFFKFCEEFGFHKVEGLGSDIKYLTQSWHIASCNVSVGYHNEHEKHEFINTQEMMDTLPKVVRMVQASKDAPCYKDK